MEPGLHGIAPRSAPKHVVIREYVRGLVGGSAPGSAAPSERELVDRFGVARMTVRQALEGLVAEGVLERFPGRGTFVARPRRRPTGISSFTEEMSRRGAAAESRTLLAERVPAATGVARALDVGAGQPVVHWRRLRFADGRPACLADTFLAEAFVPGLLDRTLPRSLYDELAARDRRPDWAEDSVSAGIVSPDEAEHLDLAPDAIVLRHSRRALWANVPIEVTRSVYPAEQHTLWWQFAG